MRTNGLHHAVSLGTIDVASKPSYTSSVDRSYESEDENMMRRKLRHTSSIELYSRPSVYSKGDIREQYCLTDRQLNTIERPRRERFFGCWSRRGVPQSFLGVCVGRRAPSDENLAAYAPFHKYPRYHHQYPYVNNTTDSDWESSYFRRQPTSILSNPKMVDVAVGGGGGDGGIVENANSVGTTIPNDRYPWPRLSNTTSLVVNKENSNLTSDQSSYHCPTHTGVSAGVPHLGPSTPRAKHVSFARSHTLTSFDDVNLGLRSSGRLKTARSQERLIGGKKPVTTSGLVYEPTQQLQPNALMHNTFFGPAPISMHHPAFLQQHIHAHHGHRHSHQHHRGSIHLHQVVPGYPTEVGPQVPTEQTLPVLNARPLTDNQIGVVDFGVNIMGCQPPSPEILVVEKKFRNAMKTQATQTEVGQKEDFANVLALSPRTIHRVKVVSQGAQTCLQNGKKLTKSLSEMPNGNLHSTYNACGKESTQYRETQDHEVLQRTQSEEPSRLPLDSFKIFLDGQNNINYYEPPPPLELPQATFETQRESVVPLKKLDHLSMSAQTDVQVPCLQESLLYESNSLPRVACNHHRLKGEYNSLPRRDPTKSYEVCKHITVCSELSGESNDIDFSRLHLLPPPIQYCKDDKDMTTTGVSDIPKSTINSNRRLSMMAILDQPTDSPFKRDDVRRQSMPIYMKVENRGDGFSPRTDQEKLTNIEPLAALEEKEIFIDFKPHVSQMRSIKSKYRSSNIADNQYFQTKDLNSKMHIRPEEDWDSCESSEADDQSVECSEENEEDIEKENHLYENVPVCSCMLPSEIARDQFRKRSVSLDDAGQKEEIVADVLTPQSPCREEMLANASTYPSSDSLANDVTRDHSDGIWNESQVTVLTAEQKDVSESSFNSNLLLTPSSKRKNLILQHQQRSSIDTDVLDLEDQQIDHSPTYSNVPATRGNRVSCLSISQQQKTTLTVPSNFVTPSIAVTLSHQNENTSPKRSPDLNGPAGRSSSISPHEGRKSDHTTQQQYKNVEMQTSYLGRSELNKFNVVNTDISECSTNTDEYVTCTDTSKRTPGIKTPPTTTSSSSTTQRPVSTQSSQMDKTHGGSSFESASSLYSSRGEALSEDVLQINGNTVQEKRDEDTNLSFPKESVDITKRSPSHSISSTSSGSYNMTGVPISTAVKNLKQNSQETPEESFQRREGPKFKPESVSDDERSEVRYSSSGYYESPHDEEFNALKPRRHRMDDDRKRRKTSMKMDIEKENMRALTSPIRKPQSTAITSTSKEKPLDEQQQLIGLVEVISPSKVKRFRPKIRRQLRKSSRDESTPRRPKNLLNMFNVAASGNPEKLLDTSVMAKPLEKEQQIEKPPPENKTKSESAPPTVKSTSEVDQLKAKSVESLRSVSPGSDSVFYSETDGVLADQHGHCLHCGKEMDISPGLTLSVPNGNSVESLPHIENETEHDIVKPPSDFADSPITRKTPQRLYKKMDKRFRSEERYHGERGRLYKTRQENIRAKSEERSRELSTRNTHTLRPSGSSPSVLPDSNYEQSQQLIYRGHYDPSRYARLTDADIWTQLDHQSFDRYRDRRSSTESERSFHSKYQVILHRLVQRRCTLEMYHRQKNNTFRVDKTITVKSDSGEFGFRIHGSKPVVVAAIEPDTPAENSGLEVGDIIISVNGVQVLDKHHTEVVKIAHDGCETLELQVARTIGILMNEQQEPRSQPILSGYLWRQSGQAKGSPNKKKWVRRWFCLRPDNCLYYYKTENDAQPVGAMIMVKHTVEPCPPEIGKPFAFKVDSGEGIPLYVAAESEDLAKCWINILKQSAMQGNPWLDKCARNLYQPPTCILKPECFGYLMKLGSRWRGWTKRYCVLKDSCLYFYQDANSKTAFGIACLHGYKVASLSSNASGKKNSFEIIPPESKLRHYYFSTESEMDKKRWISALEYSIDRWIKSG